MNRFAKITLVVFVFAFAISAGAGFAVWQFLAQPSSESIETTTFEIRPGESFKTIAKHLQDQGLVSSARKLEIYARVSGMTAKVRVGEYAIAKNLTPQELLVILTSGHSIEYPVTIQEGFNRFEIAEALGRQGLINKDEFLALTRDPGLIKELLGENLNSLEGYLFPETYKITKFTGAKGLIRMMVSRFKESYAKIQNVSGRKFTRHELVTLASIIEKETGAPEERPVISSVFHNRLRQDMRLQTDPTVIYGIWEKTGIWNRNISRDDLLSPNRYNTYTFAGLPFGPISNPGFEALRAAGAPAQTEYLFFVSRNDGTHIFSRDYSQHQQAVTQFQVNSKAREGKSWRDLSKREAAPAVVVSAPEAPVAKTRKLPTSKK